MVKRNGCWRSAKYLGWAYGRYRAAGDSMVRRHVVLFAELDRWYRSGRLALRRRLSEGGEGKEGRVALEWHSSPVKAKEST